MERAKIRTNVQELNPLAYKFMISNFTHKHYILFHTLWNHIIFNVKILFRWSESDIF